jgi:hypothetical protein
LPENADNIIFATCILYNYLRDHGVGLSDMGSSENVRSNLIKIPNQERALQSAFEVRDKLKKLFNSPSLCFVRMVECNVRLIYNIQLSWMFPWKKKSLTICANTNNFHSFYSILFSYVVSHILPLPQNTFSVIC